MAIFQLVDSKPSALIVPDDDNAFSAIALANLFIEKNVPFHVAMEMGAESEMWSGFEEYLLEEPMPGVIAPHFVVDCHAAGAHNDLYLPYAEMFPEAIILSSTPHLTSAKLYSVVQNPNIARINLMAGFFPNMPTIEFAPSPTMDAEHRLHTTQFLQSLGIQTETIQDIVGFVAPRIVAMLANEAAFALMEGVSSAKEIDDAMRLGTNYPKGPLQWADEIGIDVIVALLDALFAEYHQERYRACRLLRQYADCGLVGERVGKGFYEYSLESADENFFQ